MPNYAINTQKLPKLQLNSLNFKLQFISKND